MPAQASVQRGMRVPRLGREAVVCVSLEAKLGQEVKVVLPQESQELNLSCL